MSTGRKKLIILSAVFLLAFAIGMMRAPAWTGEGRDLFRKVLLTDIIPFVEARFPVKTDKWSRAMAGLSMGSYQTSVTTLTHPELFGYAGGVQQGLQGVLPGHGDGGSVLPELHPGRRAAGG